MFDMQDVSQLGDSAGFDSNDALDTTQSDVGSDPATGSGQDPVNTKPSPKMIDAERYNKLMAAHQKVLGAHRQTQSERESYAKRIEELSQKFDEFQKSSRQPAAPQSPNEPNFEQMSPTEIRDYFKKEASEAAFERLQSEQKKQQEAQEQTKQQQAREEEEKWYQSSWDKVFSEAPDADVDAIETFMRTERIFNPAKAYELMNKDTLTQKEVAKAKVETSKKIASNSKNFTEGAGKAGIETPKKAPMGSKTDRKNFIANRLKELMADSTNY